MIDSKKHLLVISAYTPPNPAVGGKRFAFLNQEFVRHGHEITVLTLPMQTGAVLDSSVPRVGKIIQVSSILPLATSPRNVWDKIYNKLLVALATPDQWIGWLLPVVHYGLKQIRTRQVDIVIATAPPFTSLLAGAILARLTDVPLILDYRDPWTGYVWPKKKFSNPAWHRQLESWVVQQATGLVFVTQTMSEAFVTQFPDCLGKPFRIITNGLAAMPTPQRQSDNAGTAGGKKKIIYAGNCYGERSIWILLEQLIRLINQGLIQPYMVEIDLFGNITPDDLAKIKEYNAEELLHRHDPIPHDQIIDKLRHGDLLYLISGRDVSYALPYKIFDYLAAGRPILAIAPIHSEVHRFMTEHHCGLFAPINDPERIAYALNELLSDNIKISDDIQHQFYWSNLAGSYMKFINDVTINGRNNA